MIDPALAVAPHPLLDLGVLVCELPAPLGELDDDRVVAALALDHPSGLPSPDDRTRAAVRDLLRHGGFKPTGRSKPASEYLRGAAAEGRLGSINRAVDLGNAASLHSGLPISVIDLDRARAPLAVAIAPAGARYVFNAGGQEIDVAGLLCLIDGEGPCANAVKDAQRTKTDGATRRTLTLIWGTRALPGLTDAVAGYLRALQPDLRRIAP